LPQSPYFKTKHRCHGGQTFGRIGTNSPNPLLQRKNRAKFFRFGLAHCGKIRYNGWVIEFSGAARSRRGEHIL